MAFKKSHSLLLKISICYLVINIHISAVSSQEETEKVLLMH